MQLVKNFALSALAVGSLALFLFATTKINLATQATGVLPIANGGTNTTSLNGGLLASYCSGTVGTTNGGVYVLPSTSNSNGHGCTILASTGVQYPVMPWACTAQKMYITASAAGGAAGSGAVALRQNGTNGALTCTLGTGTSCNDTTHTISYAAGDTWGLVVTTGQATDTTANIRVVFECL